MKTTPKGPFLGINNRLPAFALHKHDVGDYLSAAMNVDIDNSGSILRRNAAAVVQAMSGAHSLFMTSDTTGFLVRGGMLYSITLPSYTETLVKVLSNDNPVYYAMDNGAVYYSNETDSGCIRSGVWYPWGLPTPNTPTTSVIAGSLDKGTYQIAVSHYNSVTGEEGGISASTNPVLSSTGGFRVTLPAATPGADKVILYVSTTNGSVPMRVNADIPAGTAYYDVTTYATGRESNQRYEEPLPAGRPFIFNGCLCSIKGSMIYEGSPFRPGYFLPAAGYIPFPTDVSNAVPAQNGIYVVADKTYWLPCTRMAEVGEAIQDVLPYGGVKTTAFGSPTSPEVGWFGAQGIVVADQFGKVKAMMSDNVMMTAPASGISAVIASEEYRRVVSCGWCMNLATGAVTQYSDYDFTSISGSYATKSDGLYTLSVVGKVDASFGIGKENFKSEYEKHMPAVYLGYASEVPMSMSVGLPTGTSHDYPARSSSELIDIHRVDTGKGLRANWFDISFSNQDGADFTVASVSFAPLASNRRI